MVNLSIFFLFRAPGKLKDYVRSGDPSFLKNIENMLERVSKFEMTLSR